ncbi:MAG: DUF1272 domain-containing protein [Bacteroidia bacterium]|nr:DUF1272 domain-containing protein [Bacteroidia bacterium]
MLELKPNCENCGKMLPNTCTDAMICSFECTFCQDCAQNLLFNVCPNCGGGFEKRPTRPNHLLEKHPPQTNTYLKPVNFTTFSTLLNRFKNIPPSNR